jgi:tetratricopeptide (TPR) repeat protein
MRRAAIFMVVGLIACGPFFYQAPPSLGSYPERLATKPWQQLFAETAPLDPALPTAEAQDETCLTLPATLAAMDAKGRLAEVDRLLKVNRDGQYSVFRANLLWELRELAADDALFKTAAPYLAWRVIRPAPLPPRPPAERPWHLDPAEFDQLKKQYADQIVAPMAEFDRLIAESPAVLLPHWQVQRGAFLFRIGRHAEARLAMDAVVDGAAGDVSKPRVLAAMIMAARCVIEESRELAKQELTEARRAELEQLRDDATNRLKQLIEIGTTRPHPYLPDAYGWLGAIAADRNELGAAVACQLERLEAQPTREITRSVVRECDSLFARLLASHEKPESSPWLSPVDDFDAAKVARHPVVARLFVQHAIDPAATISLPLLDDNESGDRYTIDFLNQRILRPEPFVQAALGALGRELLMNRPALDATTLTLLAWAATEAGEHEQALALLDQITVPKPGDETLHARAIVLKRLGRHAEAVAAFNRLEADYPASPLVNDLPFQRAIEQFRAGTVADAIVGFVSVGAAENVRLRQQVEAQMAGREPATDALAPTLQPEHHLMQWLDTLVQFAALDDLEAAVAKLPPDAGLKHPALDGTDLSLAEQLRGVLRCRALAAGDFALAKRHLSVTPPPARTEWVGARYLFTEALHLDAAGWDARVAPLAKLHAELAAATLPADRARLHLALAREWLKHRGFLTLPATGACYYANSEEDRQDLLRRQNALHLGFSRTAVAAELGRRDEATHALDHALAAAAADNPDPASAAAALELANECLCRRAEFSHYQKSRALEAGDASLSRDLYDQLRRRFPRSREARRAVYHVFTPLAAPWMPGDYNPNNCVAAFVATLEGRPRDDYSDETNAAQEAAQNQINQLAAPLENPQPGTRFADLLRDLQTARRKLDTLRPATDPDWQDPVLDVINRLDDLAAAASLPNITLADYTAYAAGRHATLPPEFRSLLDFRARLKLTEDDQGMEGDPVNDTIDGWREFLELYPDSPKLEAASLRLTRLLARQYRGRIRVRAFHFPEAPIPNGYKHIVVERPIPTPNPKLVLAAINDHEARYSTGRYQDDLDLLRAGALIDDGDYPQAMELLERILANPAQRELHGGAVLNFGDIAQRLLDPAQRLKVATALRRRPAAMSILKCLVAGDTCLARLAPLMPWLEAPGPAR